MTTTPTAAQLEEILYRHDPIGLVDDLIPADEFRPEAETIAPRLAEASSHDDVQRILHEEFVKWFEPVVAGNPERYASPATEIWRAMQ
jgi:hypothetical protein